MATCDLSRRQAFKQIAGAMTIAPVAAAALAAAADPLPALCARRAEIDAICNKPGNVPGYDLLFQEWGALLEHIADTVPTTRAGVIAQIRFLAWFQGEFEWDDTCDRLAQNMITGVEQLGAAA